MNMYPNGWDMLTPSDKIALFRSLFRGRDDLYPRWYSHREKSGYSPACSNEWVEGICEEPELNAHNAATIAFCR